MKTSIIQKSRLTGHTGSVYSLEHKEADFFYSGSGDGIVALWDAGKPGNGDAIFRASDGVYALKYFPDLKKLLVGQGSGGLHIIDLLTGKEEKLLLLHQAQIFVINFNTKNRSILTGGGDGRVCYLDNKFSLIKTIDLNKGKVRSIIYSISGNECIIGCSDGSISVLSVPAFKIIKQWQAHHAGFGVNVLCLSPDGKHLLSGSRDAHLNIYNSVTYELMQSIPAHNYAIYDIAFHTSGKIFATAGRDKVVKIWDVDGFKVLARIDKESYNGHFNSVNKLLWIDDYLISTGDDRSVIIWEINFSN